MKKEKLILFAGPASKDLGSQIARYLNEPLGYIQVGAFSDGETDLLDIAIKIERPMWELIETVEILKSEGLLVEVGEN